MDQDHSTSSDPSSSSNTVNTAHRHHNAEDIMAGINWIAAKASFFVTCSKSLLIVALILATTGASVATYFLISSEEYDDFSAQFKNFAEEIVVISNQNTKGIFGTLASLSTTYTSYALSTNQEWPLVTVSEFEARGVASLELLGASNFALAHIVTEDQRTLWEDYVADNQWWIAETIEYREGMGLSIPDDTAISTSIQFAGENTTGPYLPIWQVSPFEALWVNFDALYSASFAGAYEAMQLVDGPVVSGVPIETNPESLALQPIYDRVDDGKRLVGVVFAVLHWETYFRDVLPDQAIGITVVLRDSCGTTLTYRLDGNEAHFVGAGDFHDGQYDNLVVSAEFAPFVVVSNISHSDPDYCPPRYSMFIYPTDDLRGVYDSNLAVYYTLGVAAIFIVTSIMFVLYDYSVKRRQDQVMARAVRTDAIIASLFPSNVRHRLFGDDNKSNRSGRGNTAPRRLRSFLNDDDDDVDGLNEDGTYKTKPIADLFPNSTVFFADISGFTAWSSAREPSQVFTLLETLYGAFDKIANRLGVFKVETIGDCYVAVTGLPEPRKDHAVVMMKFARSCMEKMKELTDELEVSLGPDTGDLAMRMGMHSGQVTAGVLRGEKSRFQLFGDTVNTASRMESTGCRERIQISDTTADLLREHGQGDLVHARDSPVEVKGKGQMQTYWLQTIQESRAAAAELGASEYRTASMSMVPVAENTAMAAKEALSGKTKRLINWNVDVLVRYLKQIVASRNVGTKHFGTRRRRSVVGKENLGPLESQLSTNGTAFEEFKEIVSLPKIDPNADIPQDPDSLELKPEILSQLQDYVTKIAGRYRGNPFHNFEHASHVLASVTKLLSRIVTVNDSDVDQPKFEPEHVVDNAYGITSDPLTQFVIVFCALIHDVDHTGVPNAQLVKEKLPVASFYKEKSVAEQNSVDIAWNLLMEPQYKDLRSCIYTTADELKRFRQLIVNVVLATDIVDKELQALRKGRWEKAFSDDSQLLSLDDHVNRKATIVLEHLIQASDVSHTMQHWQVYRKWNERLFFEMYKAYVAGRSEQDPSIGWYRGELGFFDFYIIPLAKKLENCGVFGVSSHEYLNYATANRYEWSLKGEEVVKEMVERCKSKIELENSVENKRNSFLKKNSLRNASVTSLDVELGDNDAV